MVVLEAMAADLPVVASRVEGIPAAIRHGVDGLLVEPGSADDLAAGIAEFIEPINPGDYLAMSQSARTRHAECFSAKSMAKNVARIYDDVLAGNIAMPGNFT
jgi:glycosyltransferase involved in cell wall biosynthesis